jgi:hypothetical protein
VSTSRVRYSVLAVTKVDTATSIQRCQLALLLRRTPSSVRGVAGGAAGVADGVGDAPMWGVQDWVLVSDPTVVQVVVEGLAPYMHDCHHHHHHHHHLQYQAPCPHLTVIRQVAVVVVTVSLCSCPGLRARTTCTSTKALLQRRQPCPHRHPCHRHSNPWRPKQQPTATS